MMEELAARSAADPDLASKVIIAPLAFQTQIYNNAKVKTYHSQLIELELQAQSVGYGTKQLNKV